MHLPDYHGGSIVNLMRSIEAGLGARPCAAASAYPELRDLPAGAIVGARNVVLLLIDGLGYDYLMRAGTGSSLAKNLKARITSVFPSTTATAVSALLTGVGPQQHALSGWNTWLRELGCLATVLRFCPRHGGEPFSKAGIAAGRIFTSEPVFDRLPLPSHMLAPHDIVDSDYNVFHSGIATRHSYNANDMEQAFVQCSALLKTGGRKFVHLYIPHIDWTAHAHGSNSAELLQKLQQLDAAYARLLDGIKGTDTMVIATADHGFIDSPKESCIDLDDHPDLERMLMLPLCGERRVVYCYVQPGREPAFEHYVQTRLGHCAGLHRSADLASQGWFGLGPPNPRLAERIGHYTLVMKETYTLKDWIPGESRQLYIGVHGGVSAAEMFVPLILAEA